MCTVHVSYSCFIFMFSYFSVPVCKCAQICLGVCVFFSLDRSHIQIRNLLTRHSGRYNCWSGGLRVWAGGRLIAGDYKPQRGGLVSGFDQTNTTTCSQVQPLTHVHTHTHTNCHAQRCMCVHSVYVFYAMLLLV